MELLKTVLPLVIQASVGALALAVGLDATPDDALYVFRRPGKLARAFLAISVVVPVVAVLVISGVPVSQPARVGMILMALAPVPPLAPGKDLRLGGRKEYVYGLYVAFVLLAVMIVPTTVAVLNRLFGAAADAPPGRFVQMVIAGVMAPLGIGMLLQARWPRRASAAAPVVGRIALLLILIAVTPLLARAWPAMVAMAGDGTLVAMTLIAAAGVVAGHLLGGPDPHDRLVLASTAATRHPGIALMIATANFSDKRVAAIILMFVLVSFAVVALYGAVIKRAAQAPPAPAAPVTRA